MARQKMHRVVVTVAVDVYVSATTETAACRKAEEKVKSTLIRDHALDPMHVEVENSELL